MATKWLEKEAISTIWMDIDIDTYTRDKAHGKTLQKVATTTSPPLKKFCSDHHYKVTKVPWGATEGPLLLSPWLKRGFSARLLSVLLDIGHPFDLYPLKV